MRELIPFLTCVVMVALIILGWRYDKQMDKREEERQKKMRENRLRRRHFP